MAAAPQNNPTRNFLRNFRMRSPGAVGSQTDHDGFFMPGMKAVMCVHALREKAGPSVYIVPMTAVADPAVRAAEL
jgi:hypothetical protein